MDISMYYQSKCFFAITVGMLTSNVCSISATEDKILLQLMVLIIGKKLWKSSETHALSITHREAVMKFQLLQQPPLSNHLDAHAKKCQTSRRNVLLKQLNEIKFLLRQGIARRGNDETEGNLYQLLIMLSNDCPDTKSYVHKKVYVT